nr:chaperone protein dnaj gfa2, mitochondrial [Quercus suber]
MELEDLAEDIPQNSCNFPVSIPEPKYICKSCKGRSRYNDETIKVSRSGGADSDGNQPANFASHRRCSPQGSLWHPAWSEGSFEEERIKTRNSYSFGDQDVHLNVNIPSNLTPKQRELIEEFAKEEQGEYEKRSTAGASG